MKTQIVMVQCCTCGAVKVNGEWNHSPRCHMVLYRSVVNGRQLAVSHGLCDVCLPEAMGTVQEFLAGQRAAAVVV